jgi:4-hydroxyphenylpyruvate dioxygenase-like putative hemolysin
MYRIDHLAFRVKDRLKTAEFLTTVLNYKIQTQFDMKFDDGSTTKCIALEPTNVDILAAWTHILPSGIEYHRPPEYFISDGPPDSIVGRWVQERNNIGGLHHIALQCDTVMETMNDWKEKGYAEFTTETPLTCPGIVQCFSKPSMLTGVIFELIQRGKHGFCQDNVKDLISSTKGL